MCITQSTHVHPKPIDSVVQLLEKQQQIFCHDSTCLGARRDSNFHHGSLNIGILVVGIGNSVFPLPCVDVVKGVTFEFGL